MFLYKYSLHHTSILKSKTKTFLWFSSFLRYRFYVYLHLREKNLLSLFNQSQFYFFFFGKSFIREGVDKKFEVKHTFLI